MKRKRKKAKKKGWGDRDSCKCDVIANHFNKVTGKEKLRYDDSGFILPNGKFGILPHDTIHDYFIDMALGHQDCSKGGYMEKCGSLYVRNWKSAGGLIVDSEQKPNNKQIDTLIEYFNMTYHPEMVFYGPGDCETKEIKEPKILHIRNWVSRCW